MYVLVKNDEVKKIFFTKPEWYTENPAVEEAELLTDEELFQLDVYPISNISPIEDSNFFEITEKHFSEWVVNETDVTVTYNIVPLTFEQSKELLLAKIKQNRSTKVIAGIPAGESTLATDDFTRNILTSLKLLSIDDPTRTWNWKGKDGWITLDKDMITLFSGMIATHTQACFDKEHDFITLIEAATTIEDLEAIDIESNWPSTVDV